MTRRSTPTPGGPMFRRSRRAALTSATAAALAVALAAPAIACPPVLPGTRESQQVYGNPIDHIGATSATALLGTTALRAAPAGSRPRVTNFGSTLTRNPDTNNAAAFLSPADDCARPSCVARWGGRPPPARAAGRGARDALYPPRLLAEGDQLRAHLGHRARWS